MDVINFLISREWIDKYLAVPKILCTEKKSKLTDLRPLVTETTQASGTVSSHVSVNTPRPVQKWSAAIQMLSVQKRKSKQSDLRPDDRDHVSVYTLRPVQKWSAAVQMLSVQKRKSKLTDLSLAETETLEHSFFFSSFWNSLQTDAKVWWTKRTRTNRTRTKTNRSSTATNVVARRSATNSITGKLAGATML